MNMDEIMINLASDDEKLQIRTIRNINMQLLSRSGEELDQYMKHLIKSDVLWNICQILKVTNEKLLELILLFLELLSASPLFYDENVASEAVKRILQMGLLIAQVHNNKPTLEAINKTLCIILHRSNGFISSWKPIVNCHQLLEYIINLDIMKMEDADFIEITGDLLCIILTEVSLYEIGEKIEIFTKIYSDILTQMNNVLQDNRSLILRPLYKIVKMCRIGLKLCDHGRIVPAISPASSISSMSDDIVHHSQIIIDKIFKIMTEVIIPDCRITNFKPKIARKILQVFLICLNEFYQRSDVDLMKLSWTIGSQRYLRYFYEIIKDGKYSVALSCDCLARILTNMIQTHLSVEKTANGAPGLRRDIEKECLAVATSQKVFGLKVAVFLPFFHYCATKEYDLFGIQIHQDIAKFSIDNPPEVPALQAIWCLFSITSLENPRARDDEFFHVSSSRLIAILQKVGIENCYVHHPALIISVLEKTEFPIELRRQVVKLWLTKDCDIYKFIPISRRHILINCLLHVVETGTVDLIVKASSELLALASESETMQQHATQVIWQGFPRFLHNFEKQLNKNLEGYLKLLNKLETTDASLPLITQCSDLLIRICDDEELELNRSIKILIIQQASRMLSVALSADDKKVVTMYINRMSVVRKLYDSAVKNDEADDDNLSTVCYECLTLILISQSKFLVMCETPLIIKSIDLYNILLRQMLVSLRAMAFLQALWSSDVKKPAITCADCADTEWRRILIGIYRTYIHQHRLCTPSWWEFTFNCLARLLLFYKKNYIHVLSDCLDYGCNLSIVIQALNCKYRGPEFFNFLKVWLQLSYEYDCACVQYALESKIIREGGESVYFVSIFIETVQALNNYMNDLVSSETMLANEIEDIRVCLKKYA